VIMKKEANSRVREYSYTTPCAQFLHAQPPTLWLVVAAFEIRTLFSAAGTQRAPIMQRLCPVGSCSLSKDTLHFSGSAEAPCCKVAGSRPDELNDFFPICLVLPAALGAGVNFASVHMAGFTSSLDNCTGKAQSV
jgi:hypothetical protein